jgi:hypothetical protein
MTEIWKWVRNYKGRYKVSTFGRVKSVRRQFQTWQGPKWLKARFLKGTPSNHGHLTVNLTKNGRCKSHYIHRLVLEAFVGPCPDGMECRHTPDPNPTNNRLTNIRWGTKHGQFCDRIKDDTVLYGSRSKTTLTEHVVALGRRLHRKGWGCKRLVRKFGGSTAAWSAIVNRKTWKHVT